VIYKYNLLPTSIILSLNKRMNNIHVYNI